MARGASDGTDKDRPLGPRTGEAPVIVGIGASAGGILALQQFFAATPSDTGAAFVVIVHLDPDGHSELSNILSQKTKMPVAQVGNLEKLLANHVYVIPPNRRLRISDHEISAEEFDEPRGQRAPIDLFFRSLAQEHGDGIAILLTGAGSDGTIGVRAVKEAGGIILVQDPTEAEYPSMPRSAIAAGVADFVLPVHDLATRLVELLNNRNLNNSEAASRVELPIGEEEPLRQILAHVRVRAGHDFSRYKRSTILRRLARRMQITRTDGLAEYYNLLRNNAEEAQALLGDLLVSVTTFFRDADSFEALKTLVFPRLFERKESTHSVRVWVPGCATGEEAYSMGILLLEEASRHPVRPTIQVFGSDIDGRALVLARDGSYPTAIEADVSEERLRRFFSREGDYYRVRRELRDVVLFASHSLLKDPPFSHIDLISCRNLLIYLDRQLQQQACNTFYYALNPGGFLFLGSSETADSPPGLFRIVERKHRIYESTAQSTHKPQLLPRLLGGLTAYDQSMQVGRALSASVTLSEAAQHRAAIEKTAPPSILVDRSHRVVHLSDTAGRYLQPAGGPLSGDIVDLVRSELRFELRSALHRTFENGQTTLTLAILVRFNGAPHRVHMLVKAATPEGEVKPQNAVVMFLEGEALEPSVSAEEPESADGAVQRLSEELRLAHARLRTMREESETANEELRAANEELQSMNEEYRSTSEELETSREELQSINEELQTVNAELKQKLDAVSRANSDMQNLMAATDFGTLFLDTGLRIKRFTDQVTTLFRITPNDEGRPITDFAHLLEYNDLVKDAQAVLADLIPIKRELHSQNGRWYDVRLRPYRTTEDKIDGVVITFVDITERRHFEEALKANELLLRQEKRLVDLSRDPIFIWDFDGGIVDWNRGSEELYGYSRGEVLGKRKEELLQTTLEGSSFDEVREKLARNRSWSGEVQHRTKDHRILTVESRVVLESIGNRRLALESTRDITDRKLWERRQRLLRAELAHRVKNMLAVVQAIVHQTLRQATSTDDQRSRLEGRLMALARAHSLLVDSDWMGADLNALARQQLGPYMSEDDPRIVLSGGAVLLPAEIATPIGLVLHELATNAAKHGALSTPKGSVSLSWTRINSDSGRPVLSIVWQETGGPPAKPPRKPGFGTSLIDKGIPEATVNREYKPDGLVCTMELPFPQAPRE